MDYDVIVVGCGLTGAVIARELAEKGKRVCIFERRNHIAGNMYDYVDENGILVALYGPHTFHTKQKYLYDYMCKFGKWNDFKLTCGAVINDKYTPTPFNFQTIDDFYDVDKAEKIKKAIEVEFKERKFATVVELLEHKNSLIKEFAEFLFKNDYAPYTAKQWGVSPETIDPSVLKRVPVRFSYEIGYFDDDYQVMPEKSFTEFFKTLLNHSNISIQLGVDAKQFLELKEDSKEIYVNGERFTGKLVYTGAIDEMFNCKFGKLPYRSLRFEWKSENKKSFQAAPVVAYPQEKDFTRITEYTKVPVQDVGEKTVYAVEYPLPYKVGEKNEPYYPVLTEESQMMYQNYREEADKYPQLCVCGRLGDFKYYNMDQALERALECVNRIAK